MSGFMWVIQGISSDNSGR